MLVLHALALSLDACALMRARRVLAVRLCLLGCCVVGAGRARPARPSLTSAPAPSCWPRSWRALMSATVLGLRIGHVVGPRNPRCRPRCWASESAALSGLGILDVDHTARPQNQPCCRASESSMSACSAHSVLGTAGCQSSGGAAGKTSTSAHDQPVLPDVEHPTSACSAGSPCTP